MNNWWYKWVIALILSLWMLSEFLIDFIKCKFFMHNTWHSAINIGSPYKIHKSCISRRSNSIQCVLKHETKIQVCIQIDRDLQWKYLWPKKFSITENYSTHILNVKIYENANFFWVALVEKETDKISEKYILRYKTLLVWKIWVVLFKKEKKKLTNKFSTSKKAIDFELIF